MGKQGNGLVTAARVFVILLVIASIGAGYTFSWRTFVRWWEPVAWAAGFGLAFGPFARHLFASSLGLGRRWAAVAAVLTAGALSYGALMTVNYCFADKSTLHPIDAVVTAKYTEERTRYRRAGRGRAIPAGKYNVYYLTLTFDNGATRQQPVNASVYTRTRIGSVKHYDLEKGFFGYKVFIEPQKHELSK